NITLNIRDILHIVKDKKPKRFPIKNKQKEASKFYDFDASFCNKKIIPVEVEI
ncbi:MAG: hypothetical protein K0R90_1389, partial [Oscillospiraceae bacterium]|nr:hypothetical protein [Oscillospiraceae bacterium]